MSYVFKSLNAESKVSKSNWHKQLKLACYNKNIE